jgi:hydrogenase maturation protease
VSARTLVAGIGNIFLSDDGFGVEVANRLSEEQLPEEVRVFDAGIRARDLAYELLDGAYTRAILVDAVARGGPPGTVYVIEPDVTQQGATAFADINGHAMDAEGTLAFVHALGGASTRILIVGCEPASVEEGMGLTPPVAAAVDEAVSVVRRLICA